MLKILKSAFRTAKSAIIAVILFLVISFMVSNRQKVDVSIFPLPFNIETRLFIVMIACFVAGLAFGLLFLSQNIIKNALHNYKNNKKKPVDLQS